MCVLWDSGQIFFCYDVHLLVFLLFICLILALKMLVSYSVAASSCMVSQTWWQLMWCDV